MQRLISRVDIAKYRQISKTPNDEKLNEIILDAQILDVQPLLGEVLYNRILASPDDFKDLLDGGVYEYDGIEYTSYGLKMLLSYFAYARYIMHSSVIDTPYSVVEKLSADSRPADASQKKNIYIMNRDAAFSIWENVKNYLTRTKISGFKAGMTGSSTGLRFTRIK